VAIIPSQLETLATPLNIVCLITVLIGTITDLRSRKIPNWLTFPSALIAVIMQYFAFGYFGIIWSVAGWFTGACLTMAVKLAPLIFKRYSSVPIGYGDTKLIAAIGAFTSPQKVLIVFFYFCLFFGLMSMIKLASAMPWKMIMLMSANQPAKPTDEDRERMKKILKSTMPVAPAILLATICGIGFGQQTLQFLGFVKP
jgi:Flp pilus assembly protein protease CpaA